MKKKRKSTARHAYYDKTNNLWRAQVGINNRDIYVGSYETEIDAHRAAKEFLAQREIVILNGRPVMLEGLRRIVADIDESKYSEEVKPAIRGAMKFLKRLIQRAEENK